MSKRARPTTTAMHRRRLKRIRRRASDAWHRRHLVALRPDGHYDVYRRAVVCCTICGGALRYRGNLAWRCDCGMGTAAAPADAFRWNPGEARP